MSLTYRGARDEVYGLLTAAWDANKDAIFGGYAKEIRYAGVGDPSKPDGDCYWVWLSMQSIDSEQSTLSTCVGKPGQVRYTDFGLVFAQLFGPRSDTEGPGRLPQMSEILRNTLRRKNRGGHVWFRAARIIPLSEEEKWLRENVVAEYNYDEII